MRLAFYLFKVKVVIHKSKSYYHLGYAMNGVLPTQWDGTNSIQETNHMNMNGLCLARFLAH